MKWKISQSPIQYPQAIEFMESHIKSIYRRQADELVWLLEHPPLYTAGTSAKTADLITPDRFPVYESGRGGQYTYHGTGQRIAYVMLDLKQRQTSPDLRKFVCDLEQVIINIIAHFNIDAKRKEGAIGIWVDSHGIEEKIAAIGIRIRQGVSYHGFAINIAPDLEHFSGIIPCGIKNHGVTSLQKLGVEVGNEEFDKMLKLEFEQIFNTQHRTSTTKPTY